MIEVVLFVLDQILIHIGQMKNALIHIVEDVIMNYAKKKKLDNKCLPTNWFTWLKHRASFYRAHINRSVWIQLQYVNYVCLNIDFINKKSLVFLSVFYLFFNFFHLFFPVLFLFIFFYLFLSFF